MSTQPTAMEIPAKLVKELRERTGAGFSDCRAALVEANGNIEKAIEILRNHEGGIETVSTIYLTNEHETLLAAVPLANLVLAKSGQILGQLSVEPLISCHPDTADREVAEQFDKYNLGTLPVVSKNGKLLGVITADDVISMLRDELGERG